MICHGPSDSGKTTWLTPILEIVDKENVATVTREGKFACHMITEETELLFIDR